MKSEMWTVIVLYMTVLGGWVQAGWVPSDQVFTYQGRLYDNGTPLDGTVDLKVWMRDGPDPNTAEYVGVVDIDNHPVSDGYLTLHLNLEQRTEVDMPELFDGSDRWLEFWMRPGDSDPNVWYEELSPLIKVEATPFAHAAYRLKTPAALRSETTEPTLTLANTGDGSTVYFEDATGTIEYRYDAMTTVTNDLQRNVGGSFSSTVDEDKNETIYRDSTVLISCNAATTVGVNNTTDIGGNSSTTISGNEIRTVTIDLETMIGADRSETIGHNSTTTVGTNMTTNVGNTMQLTAGNTITLLSSNPVQLQDEVFVTHDPNDRVIVNGALTIQPQSVTPAATSGYGKVFVSSSDGKLYYIDTGGGLHDLIAITNDRISFSVKRMSSYPWPTNSGFATVDFTSGISIWDNTGDGFTTKNGTFIAPADGVYTFHGAIFFTGLTKGDVVAAAIKVDARRYRGDMKTAAEPNETVRANVTVWLQAGDVVALEGYVSAASPPTVFGAASSTEAFTHFNGARVD